MSEFPPPHRYRISGLDLASEVALPARTPVDPAAPFSTDVTLRVAAAPSVLDRVDRRGPNWAIGGDRFLLDLPGIGRFMAAAGREITVEPAAGVAIDDVLVFATGTALAGILYQRGALLLHGAAVVRDGRAFAICGRSGVGKSTMAAALGRAGCGLLSDDVSAIVQADGGAPAVLSDGRVLRLHPDSVARTGLADRVGTRVRSRIEKYHVTPPEAADPVPEASPLAAVYILADANALHPSGIATLSPIAAAEALLRQSYRRRLALAYSGPGRLAQRTAALLGHAKVHILHRPRDFARLDETVARLLAHVDGSV